MHFMRTLRRSRSKLIGFLYRRGNDTTCPRPRPRTLAIDSGTLVGFSQRLWIGRLKGRSSLSAVRFSKIRITLAVVDCFGSIVNPKLVLQKSRPACLMRSSGASVRVVNFAFVFLCSRSQCLWAVCLWCFLTDFNSSCCLPFSCCFCFSCCCSLTFLVSSLNLRPWSVLRLCWCLFSKKQSLLL